MFLLQYQDTERSSKEAELSLSLYSKYSSLSPYKAVCYITSSIGGWEDTDIIACVNVKNISNDKWASPTVSFKI